MTLVFFILLYTVLIIVYWPSLRGEFITDDFVILDMEEMYGKFSGRAGRSYRLTSMRSLQAPRWFTHWTYLWTWRAFGFATEAWHVFNWIIHAANCYLVFRLLELAPLPQAVAYLSVFIMALHPVQVPAVAWISGRAGLLSVFWSYAALLLLAYGSLLFIPAFLFALGSKEDAWIFAVFAPMVVYFSPLIVDTMRALWLF